MKKKLDEHKFDLAIEAPINSSKIEDQLIPLLQMRKDCIFDSCEFELNYSNYHSNVMGSMSILSNS